MKQQSQKNKRVQRRSDAATASAQDAAEKATQKMPSPSTASPSTASPSTASSSMASSNTATHGVPSSKKHINFFSKEAFDCSPLNYYHLFWIFIIASVVGLILETIYHFFVFGGYESRAGLVWGPFSPIYGCGAVLFTLVSRGKHVEKKSKTIIIIFLSCALAGAALEFIASWLMQNVFGVIAWDYSNEFLNIGGRTSLLFGVMWGVLGTAWICWFLPVIIKLIERIPEGKHALVTTLVSVFMLLNILTTFMVVGRAYERSQGVPEQSQLDAIMDTYYGDDFVEDRFENATIDPSLNESEKSGSN